MIFIWLKHIFTWYLTVYSFKKGYVEEGVLGSAYPKNGERIYAGSEIRYVYYGFLDEECVPVVTLKRDGVDVSANAIVKGSILNINATLEPDCNYTLSVSGLKNQNKDDVSFETVLFSTKNIPIVNIKENKRYEYGTSVTWNEIPGVTTNISVTNENELNILDEVASALKKGEVVAIPTETVYGLGANALFSKSAQKIFTVKGRPSDNPLIVHIAKEEDAKEVGKDIPEIFYTLSKNFWPGPLTMIVKKNDKIPYSVTGGLDTVGIRIPDNIYTRYLIEKAGCPVAAPSANISGTVSATSSQYVYDDFKDKIPYIVDNGNCEIGLESTVINLTNT